MRQKRAAKKQICVLKNMSSTFKLIIYAACSLASLSIFPMIDIEQDVSLVVVAVPIISVLFRFGKT